MIEISIQKQNKKNVDYIYSTHIYPFPILLSALQGAKKQWEFEIESTFFFFFKRVNLFSFRKFPKTLYFLSRRIHFLECTEIPTEENAFISWPLSTGGYPLQRTFRFQIDPSFQLMQIWIELCNKTLLMNLLPEVTENCDHIFNSYGFTMFKNRVFPEF